MENIAELKGHTSRVLDVALSPCSQIMVSCSNDFSMRFWSLKEVKGRKRKIYKNIKDSNLFLR